MKQGSLFFINDQLEAFMSFFQELKLLSDYAVEIINTDDLLSGSYDTCFLKKNLTGIVLAGMDIFVDRVRDKFGIPRNNAVYLYSDNESFSERYTARNRNCYLVNYDRRNLKVQVMNFNVYLKKIFSENTLSFRLSEFITDSFREIAGSEILKKQKEEIEKLNNELDMKNVELLRELNMAQRVQLSIIPNYGVLPKLREIKFGCNYSPMESIGGDLFDIIRVGRNCYGLLMADVSGHGVPAALITTMSKIFFNAHSKYGVSPGSVCEKVHDDIYKFIGDLFYYLTAFYGIINLETGEFQYANAGHQPGLLFRQKSGAIENLEPNGTLIGIFRDPVFKTETIRLEKDDRLLLYTDGIIEAKNLGGEIYSTEKLKEFLACNHKMAADVFVEELMKDVDKFSGGLPPVDDRAVLYLEFVSTIRSE